jgi:membrane-bound ClpP family serine protease
MEKKEKTRNWLPKNQARLRGTTFSSDPARREALVGREGKTVTTLHPTGEIRVGGKLFDAVAEGAFIEEGERVQITGTRDFRLIVERVK